MADQPVGEHPEARSLRLGPDATAQGLAALQALNMVDALARKVAELEDANDRLTQIDKLRTQFVANVSHELRNPLTVIRGSAERLLESPLEPDQRRDVQRAIDGAALLLKRVNNLLEVAKLEHGDVQVVLQPVDLGGLVRRVVGQYESLAVARDVRLVTDVDNRVVVAGDEGRLVSLVSNLIGNALKFTPAEGTVRVTLRAERATGSRSVVIEVADSGPGVPPEARALVFQPFRQADGRVARSHGGTGLGLAIVAEVARLHRGDVAVGDAPEGGALFTVRLPTATDALAGRDHGREPGDVSAELPMLADDVSALTAELRPPAEATPAGAPRGERSVVVVADSNPDMGGFLVETLGRRYDVRLATDVECALEVVRRLRPELVVTDVALPGPDGPEDLLAAVRREAALDDVRVMVVTAQAGDETRVRSLRAGAADFLLKPFAVAELTARVDNLVARTRSERALKAVEERFRLAFESAPIGVGLLDPAGAWRQVNRPLARLLGRDPAALPGLRLLDAVHPQDRDRLAGLLRALVEGRRSGGSGELRVVRPTGEVAWGQMSLAPAYDVYGGADGEPAYLVVQVQDITRRKSLEEQLRHQALYDQLTGLPGRELALERLGIELARATAGDERTPVAVLVCDLDHFSDVNEHGGHATGDAVLVEVARRLSRLVRGNDLAARLGGDEFLVVAADVAGPAGASTLAGRIVDALTRPIEVDGGSYTLTTSIGVALSGATSTSESLLREADGAMLSAKRSGRQRVEVHDESLRSQAAARHRQGVELRHGVDTEQLRLHFQPVVALADGRATGAEALVRWQHPREGLLGPDRFLAAALDTDLIDDVTRWVLRRAAQALVGHPHPLRQVTVNVAAQQLASEGLPDVVADVLAATGLEPGRLCLEIVQSATLDTDRRAIDRVRELARLGVGIALDDFGTGSASLTALTNLPVTMLKVDRRFIARLGTPSGRADESVVSGVLTMGSSLGLDVVAEGVETVDQAGWLLEAGCRLAQGYLYGRPAEQLPDDRPHGPGAGALRRRTAALAVPAGGRS